MRVLFWGTPDFALPPLRALIGEGFEVVGVVTQPDKPVGRSRTTLQAPPVKALAIVEGIPVLQPERPRGDDFLAAMAALEPDISVVVAYGHILPRTVIDLPPRGTLNIHASLLPALRGAAPIQAAIRQGLDETGITIMRMVPALDAGPMLHVLRTPVLPDETYGELALRLSELGALALIESLALLELDKIAEEPQDDALATYAPKVDRETARVDWALPALEVCRTVRAYDPKPSAWTTRGGAAMKLFGAQPAPRSAAREPGEVLLIDEEGLVVACGQGAARITAVQPAGKKRLRPIELARGRGIAVGDRLS